MNVLSTMDICILMKELSNKDPYTFEHSYRVMELAVDFAKHLNLSRAEIKLIKVGSLLHDIGKIKIDASILTKTSSLTKGEFTSMQLHTLYGAEILAAYSFENDIIEMALYHHERWNGKGYPHQLSDNQIPFYARLLGLIDSIEAMTGKRPYRQPLSWHTALKEIEAGIGTLYDPFLNECIQWMQIYEENFKPAQHSLD